MIVTLIDQDVRENIQRNLSVNLCVEAGAGTGKTTVLVARIVEILRSGHATVDRLAVITFTEKAAAELAARVREGIETAIAESLDVKATGYLETALRDLNRAHIETIHTFASSLLRERPIEAGLDPNFEVLDTLGRDLSFEEAYRAWLGDTLSQPSDALWTAFNRGFDLPQLRELTDLVHQNRAQLPLSLAASPAIPASDKLNELLAFVDELRELLRECTDPNDKGALQIEEILERFTRLAALRHDTGALERELLKPFKLNGNAGLKTNWNGDACREQKAICKELNVAYQEYQQALRCDALLGILPLVERFVRDYSERRRHAGQAEFDDLLIWTRDLLRDQPAVRHYFQQRFTCIMIDEFQDTDPLQVEIALYLTSDGDETGDWRTLQPVPGKLFVVGDPKQSIYRFRRADIAIYEWVKQQLLADGVQLIVQNFRTVRGVIGWVNDTFAGMIEAIDGIQPEYHPLQPVRDDLAFPHLPVVLLEGEAKGAEAVRQEEARLLAGLIERIVRIERWPVEEGGAERAALWRDIAILLPSRTGIDFYEQALAERGIPFRHEGGRAFYDRQEVRELVSCLKAIDDPTDRLSLVAALRSGAFGCSDDELFRFVSAKGQLDIRVEPDDGPDSVCEALATLRELRQVRGQLSLPQFIGRVLERTRLVEYAITLPQGEQAAANLLKVAEQARAFSGVRGGGLRAFVRWLTTSSSGNADESDASVAETRDDVVRILTIHSAKGLEFPIVALANLNSGRRERTKLAIVDSIEQRVDLRVGAKERSFTTPDFEDAYAREQQHDDAERKRLLYVAATRARDYLIVPSVSDGGKIKGMLANLREQTQTAHAYDTSLITNERTPQEPPLPVTAEALAAEENRRIAWLSEREQMLAQAARGLPVTTIGGIEAEEYPASTDDTEDDLGSLIEPDVAIDLALHRVMERIYLPNARNFDELTRWYGANAGLPDDSTELIDMVRHALESQIIARAVAAGDIKRDVGFSVRLPDGSFAEGRVDLLFRDETGLIVTDYRTDRLSSAEIEARRPIWQEQAMLSANALAAATGLPVNEVHLVFVRPGIEHSIAIGAGNNTK
ncbi:MAG TPA: UvrD-helicase domain-containing protein [Nitrolancea sp.]